MKKNKKWLLLLIIVFPSVFWLILESSTINSKRLPYYGPKKPLGGGDTAYYDVGKPFSAASAYAVMFVRPEYRNDSYRLVGLWEYVKYKPGKLEGIDFILVLPPELEGDTAIVKMKASPNVAVQVLGVDSLTRLNAVFFKHKPYYVDYSFFALVDASGHVRGFYDARYVAEIKRLTDEYRHLRLKEEKQKMINENEVRSR